MLQPLFFLFQYSNEWEQSQFQNVNVGRSQRVESASVWERPTKKLIETFSLKVFWEPSICYMLSDGNGTPPIKYSTFEWETNVQSIQVLVNSFAVLYLQLWTLIKSTWKYVCFSLFTWIWITFYPNFEFKIVLLLLLLCLYWSLTGATIRNIQNKKMSQLGNYLYKYNFHLIFKIQ